MAESENVNIFVYGALMGKLKHHQKPVAARVDGYNIVFTLKGFSKLEPSFAMLTSAPGQYAWGVVASLSKREWCFFVALGEPSFFARFEWVDSDYAVAIGPFDVCVGPRLTDPYPRAS